MKFVDVKNDVAFRKIFGNENKTSIIISFLNAILKLEGDHRIEEVSIANPYQFTRVAGEKASIIDVRAKDIKGRQFIVEMQVADVKGFDKRVQYYASRDYSMQIDSGDKYAQLRPTYFVGILDFDFFASKSYLSHHIILNNETYEHKLKDIQFSFVELKKFKLQVHQLKTLIEKWVFFIKNVENLDVIPDNVDDEGLREAYKDADKHSWLKEDLIAYDNALIAQQDAIGKIEAAEIRGSEKKAIEVVENCIARGMAVEDIADISGLSIEEVKSIIEQIKKRKKS